MTGMFSLEVAVGAVGAAILHSLWQGALIAVLTAVAFLVFRGATPNVRYALAWLGLATLTIAWLMTAIGYARAARDSESAPALFGEPAASNETAARVASTVNDAVAETGSEPAPSWTNQLDSWSRAVVPLWFIGVLGLSIRLAVGWLIVARVRKAAHEELTDAWQTRIAAMKTRLRISRPVWVAQSALVHVPMLVGWLRPMILIPAAVVSGLTTAQLEAVIAHELAHVRRHDYLANIVQTAAEILLFYHPACWWISKQIRAEREHACDDLAVSVCGDRVLYAEALADLETLRSEPPVLGLAATDGVLMRRIRRLVAAAPVRRGLSPGWAAAAVPLTALVLVLLNTDIAGTAGDDSKTLQSPTSSADRSLASDEAVVRGQVVDARSGRPVPNARVVVSRGDRSGAASTNDQGRYEVSGLAPGDYSVDVRAQGYVPARYGQREAAERGSTLEVRGGIYTTGINVRLEPAGVVTGRVFDDRGEGLAGVEVELLSDRLMPDGIRPVGVGFAQTEAEGAYRFADVLPGDYYVRAYVSPSVRPSRGGTGRVYGSTFYPGVSRSEFGQRLRLTSGQELFGVDFTLATMPTRRVSGVVVDPAGPLRPRTRVHLRAIGQNSTDVQYDTDVESNGRFEVANVVPGDYLINVFEPGSITSRWTRASRSLSVDDDVVDLELRARLGARIEGRVIRDPLATRSLDPAGVSVTFEYRLSGDRSSGFGWGGIIARGLGGAMRMGPDGVFSIESPGGMSVIRISELPPNWTVKAVRLEGTDITDQEIDFGEGVRQVEVVLTDRVSRVRGSVVERTGRRVAGGSVIVFADNSALWGESSRHVRETRSARDGGFEFAGLPPGDYLAVAVENLPPQAWMNTDVLSRLRSLATSFRLDEGEEQVVSLRVSPAPDGLIPVY